MVVGISCWEVSCLPAPALQLPLTSATLFGKYGHHFPFGGGGSSGFPHPLFHIKKLRGSVFSGARTPPVLLPSRPAPLHPVDDNLSRHEALQAHGGAQETYFQRWLAASSHLVGSQALAPKPQCQDC